MGLCLPLQGVRVRSLARELRSHMPRGQETKTWNRNSVVINSIKTLKNGPHKKKILKKKSHVLLSNMFPPSKESKSYTPFKASLFYLLQEDLISYANL